MKVGSTQCMHLGVLAFALSLTQPSLAQTDQNRLPAGAKWAAAWSTAISGAYVAPASLQGSAVSAYDPQPNLIFALPNATLTGAGNQTFRMIVKPDIWGPSVRIKLSNVFGTQPLTISAASVALQDYQADIVPGTSIALRFGNKSSVTVPAGQEVFSDGARLPYNRSSDVLGKNLAVSFAVSGTSGPASFHPTGLTTSYISAPNSGDQTQATESSAFPFSTNAFFFLNEVDMEAPKSTAVICAFGDSITDGAFSTLNGNDRWANVLSRQLHKKFGNTVSVVNEGISGNAVAATVSGQPATQRYKRDVLGLSGLDAVIWLEGINDLGSGRSTPQPVITGYQQVAAGLHQAGVKVIGATITPSYAPNGVTPANSPLGTVGPLYNNAQTDAYRRQINTFILSSGGTFDATVDFAAVTTDPSTGTLMAPFVPNSEGSAGDYLHPNRYGYQTMGTAAAAVVESAIKIKVR